jgi:hypothetical protein
MVGLKVMGVVPSLVVIVSVAVPLKLAVGANVMPFIAALTCANVPVNITVPVPLPVMPVTPLPVASVIMPFAEDRFTV